METIGSQKRESLKDANYMFHKDEGEHSEGCGVILRNVLSGKLEYWMKNDHYAGYVIEIDGVGYEFLREL